MKALFDPELFSVVREEPSDQVTKYPIYFATKHTEYGIDINNYFVAGVTLAPVDPYFEFDPIHEELGAIGAEAAIFLPAGGLQAGKFYEAVYRNESRDWETGIINDYEIHLQEYK